MARQAQACISPGHSTDTDGQVISGDDRWYPRLVVLPMEREGERGRGLSELQTPQLRFSGLSGLGELNTLVGLLACDWLAEPCCDNLSTVGTNRDSVQAACNPLAEVFERHRFRLRGVELVTEVTTVLGVELQDGWARPEASKVSLLRLRAEP